MRRGCRERQPGSLPGEPICAVLADTMVETAPRSQHGLNTWVLNGSDCRKMRKWLQTVDSLKMSALAQAQSEPTPSAARLTLTHVPLSTHLRLRSAPLAPYPIASSTVT